MFLDCSGPDCHTYGAALTFQCRALHSRGFEMLDSSHRRTALQLASQLPEGREDALAVIEHLRQLVDIFVAPPYRDRGPLDGAVVPLGASPMRRASSKGKPSALPK